MGLKYSSISRQKMTHNSSSHQPRLFPSSALEYTGIVKSLCIAKSSPRAKLVISKTGD